MAKTKGLATPKSSKPPSPPLPQMQTLTSPHAEIDANLTRVTWSSTATIHRIHPSRFDASQFNPGPNGDARFSPISDGAGMAIPTIYGGSNFECAAMETVFHEVPHAPGLKSVRKDKLREHNYSQIQSSQDLVLADLSAIPLRKLGIPRAELIETEKPCYPQTRAWAVAIHDQCPDVQGMTWTSRQHGAEHALILFGDRLAPATLSSIADTVDIVTDTATFAALIELAAQIGVKVTGK